MDKLMLMNGQLNTVVWRKYMIFFLLFMGLWLMLRTRFLPFIHTRLILRKTLGSLGKGDREDGVTPFQAVVTVLAGALRVDSVVNVTTALAMEGPGALPWTCVSTVFGMTAKYAEVVLAIHYRARKRDDAFIGGPITTLESGYHTGFLGILLAVLYIFASFGIGDVTPANTITHTITSYISMSSWSIGLIMALFIAWITFRKENLIMRLSEITIPVISVFYVAACLYLIVLYADTLPWALRLIRYDAMCPMTGVDGISGFAISRTMHFGISRGVFSNEAGVRNSPISRACVSRTNAIKQGFWEIFEVFFDTIVICTITGLMILTNGLLDNGMEGVVLTVAYFTSGFGHLGGIIFSFSVVAFAIPSILGWYYYTRECLRYLFRGKLMLCAYQGVSLVLLVFGAQLQLAFVWSVADTLNRPIAISNLISLIVLCRAVVKLAKEYLKEHGSD